MVTNSSLVYCMHYILRLVPVPMCIVCIVFPVYSTIVVHKPTVIPCALILLNAGGFCHGEFGQRVKERIVALCEEVWQGGWRGTTAWPTSPSLPPSLPPSHLCTAQRRSCSSCWCPGSSRCHPPISHRQGEWRGEAAHMTSKVAMLVGVLHIL